MTIRAWTAMAIGAIAAPLMHLPASAAPCHCKPHAVPAHLRGSALHHPSTAAERAETARLNREFGIPNGGHAIARPRAAQNPPPIDRDRQMREAYDRRLRNYYRAYPPGSGTAPTVAPAYATDAARLDPWHGYNPHDGLRNGY